MSATEQNTLLILDGHSMAFRAFYALPADNFLTATGQYTNAVHGFTSMLLSMIQERHATHVAVAFDLSTPTFRSQEYEEYKAGRAETPREFAGQIDLITQVMKTFNIPTLTMEGYEADDIVATLATQGKNAGYEVLVVSGDRDTFQLIEDGISVLYPSKGISQIPLTTAATVEEKYGVPPQRYRDLAALVGEKADNLPGIDKVGNKTAAKWINKYGSAEQILAHADEITGKVGENLRAGAHLVERNLRLNELKRDLDLGIELEATKLQPMDRDAMEELFDALEFNTMRKKALQVFGTLFDEQDTGPTEELPPTLIAEEAADVENFLADHRGQPISVYAELVTVKGTPGAPVEPYSAPVKLTSRNNNIPVTDELVSLSLATADAAVYLGMRDAAEPLWEAAAQFLADETAEKIVHDAKRFAKALHGVGLELAGVIDDVMISGYLIQPERRSYTVEELASFYLKNELPKVATEVQETLGFDDAEESNALQQRADQLQCFARALGELHQHFAPEVLNCGANQLLQGMEIPLAGVLGEMEMTGISIDGERVTELLTGYQEQLDEISEAAYTAAGEEINLSSPQQLQQLLFEKLGLPKTRKIKTGYSTDAESLAELAREQPHPFVTELLKHRDVTKLKQTVQGLAQAIATDGRIHTTYSQVATATGRLSSLRPNLQNIPVRTEQGQLIREVFTCGEGYSALMTADYSQIEMRIMAHLCQDEGLIQAFRKGEDLHRFVGSQVFHVSPEEVTPAMRSKVKAMSYGLVYGLSSYGLSKQLGIGVDEARELMNQYFDRFGAVRDYLSAVVEKAREDGFTATIEGRRRYLPGLRSSDWQRRDMAQRAALNAPIQGSAADIIKHAMLQVHRRLTEQQLRSRMLLQVHDELVLEIADGEETVVRELVTECMAGAAELSVPLDVHIGVGPNWHAAAHD